MSGIFGGGSGGKDSPTNVNIPPFEASGGITPQQQDLAQYTLGQNLTANNSAFGSSGTGMSTMATQGDTGAFRTEAAQQGQMSDTDTDAMYQLYQNDVNSQIQQLKNQTTLDAGNDQSLSGLASLVSSGFGGGTAGSLAGDATAGETDVGSLFSDAILA